MSFYLFEDLVKDARFKTLERFDLNPIGFQELHGLLDRVRLDIDYLSYTGIDNLSCALEARERIDINRTSIGIPPHETKNCTFFGVDSCTQLNPPAWKEFSFQVTSARLSFICFAITKIRGAYFLVSLATLGTKERHHRFQATSKNPILVAYLSIQGKARLHPNRVLVIADAERNSVFFIHD